MDALSNTIKTKETQLVSFSVVGPCFCFGVLKQSCQLLGGHKTITKAKIILASKSAFYWWRVCGREMITPTTLPFQHHPLPPNALATGTQPYRTLPENSETEKERKPEWRCHLTSIDPWGRWKGRARLPNRLSFCFWLELLCKKRKGSVVLANRKVFRVTNSLGPPRTSHCNGVTSKRVVFPVSGRKAERLYVKVLSLTPCYQKALTSRAEDGPQNELHTLRIEKDSTIGRRKKIDNSLRNVNQEIAKQVE